MRWWWIGLKMTDVHIIRCIVFICRCTHWIEFYFQLMGHATIVYKFAAKIRFTTRRWTHVRFAVHRLFGFAFDTKQWWKHQQIHKTVYKQVTKRRCLAKIELNSSHANRQRAHQVATTCDWVWVCRWLFCFGERACRRIESYSPHVFL